MPQIFQVCFWTQIEIPFHSFRFLPSAWFGPPASIRILRDGEQSLCRFLLQRVGRRPVFRDPRATFGFLHRLDVPSSGRKPWMREEWRPKTSGLDLKTCMLIARILSAYLPYLSIFLVYLSIFPSFYLSFYLSIPLSFAFLSIYPFLSFFLLLPIYLSLFLSLPFYLSNNLSTYLSIHLSVYLWISLSLYIYLSFSSFFDLSI